MSVLQRLNLWNTRDRLDKTILMITRLILVAIASAQLGACASSYSNVQLEKISTNVEVSSDLAAQLNSLDIGDSFLLGDKDSSASRYTVERRYDSALGLPCVAFVELESPIFCQAGKAWLSLRNVQSGVEK